MCHLQHFCDSSGSLYCGGGGGGGALSNDDTGLLLVEFCQAADFIGNYSIPKLL
jgi:hypothetical protein